MHEARLPVARSAAACLPAACAVAAALLLSLPPPGRAPTLIAAAQADELRPAVGNPLNKAKSLMAAHNYAGASAQVAIADKVKNKSADENFVIQQMRGAIAQASGDTATASRVFADLIASGRVGGTQLTQLLLAETSLSYQAKDYKATVGWAEKYMKAGGKDPAARTLLIQAYYLQADYANAGRLQKALVDEVIRAKKTPTEDQLQLLAACQKQTNDKAGLGATMTQLVTYYPKPNYWADLFYTLQTTPGFSDRLELDMDRLKLRIGLLTKQPEYMQMVQLALGENDAGGALDIIASATAKHVFGSPQTAAREQRLTALAQKSAQDSKAKLDQQVKDLRASPASTAQQLFDAGQSYVGFKQYATGIALMQQAIAKGGLRRPELALLRLGEAQVSASDKAAALASFRKVPQTTDGISGLAQLWALWLGTQNTLAAAQ